ncbi:MAG: FecR domain-containing protein [Candidatus Cyclonatronum sp.]|uniref:FecR domain-containing protein n=1 Tax=Cyclonatronum sp. TaxID=3024185 RepID=UPI0025BCE865|nr:FecR domain-containing protein [Cyclonatronum sp.]MCH8485354.1 FecR domain-containing protein [Cyclonatronum sp.]
MKITQIHRYLSGEAGAAEKKAFEDWLAASDENRAKFEEYRRIYVVSIKKAQHFDAVAALATFRKNRSEFPTTEAPNQKTESRALRPAGKRRPTGVWLKIAAVLLLALGISIYVLYPGLTGTDSPVVQEAAGSWYETGFGEQRSYRMPDGSRIRLNADSRLFLPFDYGQQTRTVKLQGEAFFDVETNAELPFIVHTAEAAVQVLGTSFVVRARAEQQISVVAVKTGRVSVSSAELTDTASVELSAGEYTIVAAGEQPAAPLSSGVEQYLGWQQQQFVFSDTPLHEMLGQLERHFNVHITLKDSSSIAQPVTARYSTESLEEILNITSLTHGVAFEVTHRNANP